MMKNLLKRSKIWIQIILKEDLDVVEFYLV